MGNFLWIFLNCCEIIGESLRHGIGESHLAEYELILDHACECGQRPLVRLLQLVHVFEVGQFFDFGGLEAIYLLFFEVGIVLICLHLGTVERIYIIQLLLII